MNKPTLWRLGVIVLILALCGWAATPLAEKINLGLDLQGGMHLVYEVDADKAVISSIERTAEDLKKFLERREIKVVYVTREEELIKVKFADSEASQKAEDIIADEYRILERVSADSAARDITYTYSSTYRIEVYRNAISQALETLRNRIDQFGVAEPTIQREGDNRILIQLPGIKDRQRAIDLIGKTARLEFRMVNDKLDPQSAIESGIPPDSEILYKKEIDPLTKKVTGKRPYLIKKKIELTGDMLANADVKISQLNMPYVSIDFNKLGSTLFATLTTAAVDKRMAIVLDDNVYSAPVIREPITGGSAMIEGAFNHEEARDLAIVLRAGSLPAPVIKLEERSVGPSLGQDSIERGMKSIIIGGAIVFVFMLIYYRLGGIIADMALGMNMIILAGALAYFGATLTLPGIAGIILTIGMAVDANVLVFERIREEIRNGKSVRAAVESGFAKAFLTIIDANVTTLIAALVLFQFGTGPVKGFAVTLSIGILASLFTAIFVSRTFFTWYLAGRRLTRINI